MAATFKPTRLNAEEVAMAMAAHWALRGLNLPRFAQAQRDLRDLLDRDFIGPAPRHLQLVQPEETS